MLYINKYLRPVSGVQLDTLVQKLQNSDLEKHI